MKRENVAVKEGERERERGQLNEWGRRNSKAGVRRKAAKTQF